MLGLSAVVLLAELEEPMPGCTGVLVEGEDRRDVELVFLEWWQHERRRRLGPGRADALRIREQLFRSVVGHGNVTHAW